jgi:hypothetical protein
MLMMLTLPTLSCRLGMQVVMMTLLNLLVDTRIFLGRDGCRGWLLSQCGTKHLWSLGSR